MRRHCPSWEEGWVHAEHPRLPRAGTPWGPQRGALWDPQLSWESEDHPPALQTDSLITQMFMEPRSVPSGNGGHVSLTPASVFHVEGLSSAPTPSPAAPHACALSLEGEARPVHPAPPSCQSPGSFMLSQGAEPPHSSSGTLSVEG